MDPSLPLEQMDLMVINLVGTELRRAVEFFITIDISLLVPRF